MSLLFEDGEPWLIVEFMLVESNNMVPDLFEFFVVGNCAIKYLTSMRQSIAAAGLGLLGRQVSRECLCVIRIAAERYMMVLNDKREHVYGK